MAKVLAFRVEVEGVEVAVRNEKELADAVKLVNNAYKEADYGSEKRDRLKKQLGELKQIQKENRAEIRQQGREYQIAADKGSGSYRALNAELVNLRARYRELSAEQRETFGPQLLRRINVLDKELKEIDQTLGQNFRNVGNYADSIRDALGSIGGIDLAAFTNPATAIAAAGAAAIAGARELAQMAERVRELRGEIQNLTGATGAELDEFTARVQGIADTFDQSQEEISNAANAVSQQLGIGFDEALSRIEEGFIAGSDQTGEFLDNLREYPAFFQEAGLGADALFQVINQQVTQGLFSDKGVDAVKEATLRLRELPQATRDALANIGITADEVQERIGQEGIGGAIALVSQRLSELEADSPEVGQALADIFGGPGEDAGLRFITSLKDINQATGSLIDTTNEYQLQQQRTLEVNQEFARVQVRVAEAMGGTGSSFENLSTQAQTLALRALLPIINLLRSIWEATQPLRTSLGELFQSLGLVTEEMGIWETVMRVIDAQIRVVSGAVGILSQAVGFVVDRFTDAVNIGREFLEFIGVLEEEQEEQASAASRMGRFNRDAAAELARLKKEEEETAKKTKELREQTEKAAVAADEYAKGSIAALRAEIAGLKQDLDEAVVGDEEGVLSKLIDAEAALEKAEQFREELRNRLVRGDEAVRVTGTISELRLDEGLENEVPELPEIQSVEEEEERAELIKQIIESRDEGILAAAKARNQRLIEEEEATAAALREIQADLFGSLNQVLNSLSESSQAREEREISALEDRYEREIDLAEGNEARQEELEQELEQERNRIRQREFEKQKRYRIASATASLAEGIVNILAAPTTIPDPFGTAFKALRIGVLTATTAAQINAISQQRAEKGAIVDGVIRGAAHSDISGGVGLIIGGRRILAENGEGIDVDETGAVVLINRRSRAAFSDELKSVQGKVFPGKRRMLSEINSYRGYGEAFERGGVLRPSTEVVEGLSGGVTVQRSVQTATVRLSDSDIDRISSEVAAGVRSGARIGVSEGMSQRERRSERERALFERTKVR